MIKELKIWAGRLKALSLALLLVLSLVCSLLISSSANAASDYGMTFTTTLPLGGGSPSPGLCDVSDVTTNWAEMANPNTALPLSYKNTWNYTSNHDNGRATLDSWSQAFYDALETGSGWAVFSVDLGQNGLGDNQMGVGIAVFDGDEDVNVIQDGLSFPSGTQYRTFGFNPNVGCRYQALQYNGGGSTLPVGEDNKIFLVASDHIVYPEDYNGENIPTGHDALPDAYPEIEYTVENKKITLRYTGNIGGCSITWGYQGEDEGDPLITNSRPSAEPYVINADEYKKYTILVDLKYFGPPAICEPFPDGVNVTVLTFTLDITGDDFSGNTGHMECTTEGDHTSCLVPSPFEDCSTYGVDLIGGFGCVIRNFGVALSILLKSLFVPNERIMTQRLNDLRDSFNAQMGFLLAPFTFLGGILQATIDTPTTNGCSIHLGNLFGNDSTVDPCNLAAKIPLLFDFLRIVIQAGVLFMVMSGLMAKYHEVLKA